MHKLSEGKKATHNLWDCINVKCTEATNKQQNYIHKPNSKTDTSFDLNFCAEIQSLLLTDELKW